LFRKIFALYESLCMKEKHSSKFPETRIPRVMVERARDTVEQEYNYTKIYIIHQYTYRIHSKNKRFFNFKLRKETIRRYLREATSQILKHTPGVALFEFGEFLFFFTEHTHLQR